MGRGKRIRKFLFDPKPFERPGIRKPLRGFGFAFGMRAGLTEQVIEEQMDPTYKGDADESEDEKP